MRIQLLPSTIDENGQASQRQHLLSIVVDDAVAIDAGSLAFSCSNKQRSQVRDIILTHTHLDHIAGLPLFIDDLFATLTSPIRIYATREMIDILERDIFNWSIYPRFSELSNDYGPVIEYREFARGAAVDVAHLSIRSIAVNHQVAANGYIVSDGRISVGITGDTAETDDIWKVCNETADLKAVLVECAFPDELGDLASVSHHLTPSRLETELRKFKVDCPVFVINMKPMYREKVIAQLDEANIPRVQVLEVGKVYEW
ncbi:MAG TPA: 3',5'-cyclic-nucleotide phosphodiesterase [Pyrinomonadaceae bacterium]|nr:3',5'-cyclic-nucleotide phosphodiesterase [Pyrinomonadaceae bacterium]